MLNNEAEISKKIRLFTALATFMSVVIVISIALDKANTMSVLCNSFLLLYFVAEIIVLCITKRRVKNNVTFDYKPDGKEQPTKVYKSTRIMSICNNAILIIEMAILMGYGMITMNHAFSMVAAVAGGMGTRSLVMLIRKQ